MVVPMMMMIMVVFLFLFEYQCEDLPIWKNLNHPIILKPIDVFSQQMQGGVEAADEVLKENHSHEEERHLDVISKSHRLEPDSECKGMWTYILFKVSLLVESPLHFIVFSELVVPKLQNVI